MDAKRERPTLTIQQFNIKKCEICCKFKIYSLDF